MRHFRVLVGRILLAAAALQLVCSQAHAICTINAAGLSITPVSVNLGTYTPPTAPAAVPINFTISGTYTALVSGQCTVAISFNRASLPATMLLISGSTTLPYGISSTASGSDTLIFTGAGLPALANMAAVSFPAPLLGINVPFSSNLTVYAQIQPALLQTAGSYADNLTVQIFNVTILNVVTRLASRAFSLAQIVAKACLIGGLTHPTADMAAIPIVSGQVSTSPIPKSFSGAACNAPATLQLRSQQGAAINAASASGFANIIDYTAVAAFSGANVSLDTGALATAVGPEFSSAVATSGSTPTGTLSVTLLPHANLQPLISGNYADTLSLTIAPQ